MVKSHRGLSPAGRCSKYSNRYGSEETNLGGLRSNLLELVSDEGVEDGHRLGGDTGIRVNLLEHLEDVELVALSALLGLLLATVSLLNGLLGSDGLLAGCGSHCDKR